MQQKFFIGFILLTTIIVAGVYFGVRANKGAQQQETITIESSKQNDWSEESVSEIGLIFQHPRDLVFRKEIADDNGRIRTVGFFLTKGSEQNPEYQLYGLFQQFKDGTQQDLEMAKKEMDASTIMEASIDGYQGIEGLIVGPKTRFITTVLKDGKLFSVSTIPSTQENKNLTKKIIDTFKF